MADSGKPNEGELILYRAQEGDVRIEVLYQSETFWLNQKKIAELFGVDLRTISEHLQNIYASGELTSGATLRKIRRVQREGSREVSREIEFYNLDAIISVSSTKARFAAAIEDRWQARGGLAQVRQRGLIWRESCHIWCPHEGGVSCCKSLRRENEFVRRRCSGRCSEDLEIGSRGSRATIRACLFARAIAERTASDTPTGR